MIRFYSFYLLIFALMLFKANGVEAASVYITSTGNGAFVINGSGMDAIAGIDLTVDYDSTQLASPSVSQGSLISGALMAARTNNPGTIKIAVINAKPFPANGQIALITFATHTGTGRIAISTSMFNAKGAAVTGEGNSVAFDSPASTNGNTGFVATPGIPFSQQNAPPASATGSTEARSAPIQAYLGTVTLPSDAQTKSDEKPADASSTPGESTEPVAVKPIENQAEDKPAPESKKPEKVTMTSYKSALENFRTFKGDRTPAELIALFNKQITPTIRQEPAFTLSDGKTPVKIHAEIISAGDKSPNFALEGAKLVSLNVDAASFSWIAEALPHAGVIQASLTILTENEIIEYPLTLAPLVEGVTPSEADFVVFLKDSGAKPPKRDLNGDGKHDYLDDYIYTANFLTKKSSPGKVKK